MAQLAANAPSGQAKLQISGAHETRSRLREDGRGTASPMSPGRGARAKPMHDESLRQIPRMEMLELVEGSTLRSSILLSARTSVSACRRPQWEAREANTAKRDACVERTSTPQLLTYANSRVKIFYGELGMATTSRHDALVLEGSGFDFTSTQDWTAFTIISCCVHDPLTECWGNRLSSSKRGT